MIRTYSQAWTISLAAARAMAAQGHQVSWSDVASSAIDLAHGRGTWDAIQREHPGISPGQVAQHFFGLEQRDIDTNGDLVPTAYERNGLREPDDHGFSEQGTAPPRYGHAAGMAYQEGRSDSEREQNLAALKAESDALHAAIDRISPDELQDQLDDARSMAEMEHLG